jgi:protein deglycase
MLLEVSMNAVLVPLAQGCEELEAVTIIDILRRAGIQVDSAGLEAGPVRASRGTVLVPDITLEEAMTRDYAMIALPGGMPGMVNLKHDARIKALLQKMAAAGKYTTAICAAPAVLADAGLLEGKQATSYPGFLDEAKNVILRDEAVVCDGRVITSRGPGTAMDFALELVETLAGHAKRIEVERALQRSAQH